MNKSGKRDKWLSALLLVTAIIFAGCGTGGFKETTQLPSDTPAFSPGAAQSATPISTATSEMTTKVPMSSGPFKMVTPLDEITTGAVESLISTADGSIWLITRQEIVKIMENYLTVYNDDYPGYFVGVDSIGRVWTASEDFSQIFAWDGKTWTTYGADVGWAPLDENYYREVYPGLSESQGTLWLATSQDTRSFDGTTWSVFTRQDMGMAPPLYDALMPRFSVKVLESGKIFVGECDWGGPGPFGGGGARWYAEGEWQGETSPVASGCVNAILDDDLGRVWIGVNSRLWRYDSASGDWVEFSPPESPIAEMRFGFIDSLAVDSNNEAWTEMVLCGGASCYGNCVLYHLHDGKWNQIGKVGEYDSGYWGPLFDVNGIPWIYWEGGIYRIKGDVPELVTPLDGRFGTRDNAGRVWFVAPYENRDMLWVLENI